MQLLDLLDRLTLATAYHHRSSLICRITGRARALGYERVWIPTLRCCDDDLRSRGASRAPAALNTPELYIPATGVFSATASMANARSLHTATLLQNGDVVVAGGEQGPTSVLERGVVSGPVFAGTPGTQSCHDTSTAALTVKGGGLAAAAKALGYKNVTQLQNAITAFCGD